MDANFEAACEKNCTSLGFGYFPWWCEGRNSNVLRWKSYVAKISGPKKWLF
ncbi:hypothetical protein LGM42_27840 [Burkholderia sp. AU39826]|uniref:hypothetical protein n=1 Tax=Burkholderia TaxID=32008 RepID=UPI001CF1FF68|nr:MULTISPECIES: hypothetical protein [Burkholderia]MCA7973685.1 hypothetical protein [Burkholderia sp. AU39826]MCA8036890.1 hypothetical protein [Burkholderia arboris]